ncbi:MAG: antibiotic biosynthesis monooxygenase family protein [Pseudomonadota bacterium]
MQSSKRLLIGAAGLLMVAAAATAIAGGPKTATISADQPIVTMVNVITPKSGGQDDLVKALEAGMASEMSKQPGFISASVLRSGDSEHVTVIAQWDRLESVAAAGKLIQSGGAPNMARAFTSAKPDYHRYKVISVHTAQKTN